MPVVLDAIHTHEHYDQTGTRVVHAAGDRYTLEDAPGMTAEVLAHVFVEAGVASVAKEGAPARKKPKAIA